MNNQRVLRLGMGWIRLGLLMIGLVIGLGGDLLAQGTAQTIRGKVLDESGDPLPMASVLVVGTKVGVTTNSKGDFTIKVPAGKSQLLIRFVSYKSQTVAAKDGMVVKLQPEATTLDNVVVTGMVATDKRLFTGASDKLKADKVKMAGMADISRGLEGKSAGVSVQNLSGTFGTAPKIRVRGATSIMGSSKPLWVVDGVIQEDVVDVGADDLSSGDATTLLSSAIAGLNADDIESFQILKDGSATSIYGAKAMAGVIVITTKKGRSGSSSFSYTGEFTSRFVPSYRDYNIMNSQDQMEVYNEMERKGWLNFARVYNYSSSGIYGKMYHLTHDYDPATGVFGLENTPEARAKYLHNAEMRNTNWFGELFSPALIQNHSLSFSGGTKNLQTYVSVSAMLDPGWMRASNVRRYTGNLNATYTFSPKLSVSALINLSSRMQRAPGTVTQDANAATGEVSRGFDINPFSYALNTSRTLDPNEFYTRDYAPFNIKHELDNNYIDLGVKDIKLQLELKWKPIKGLTLALLGAYKDSGTTMESIVTEYANRALAFRAMQDATVRNGNQYLWKDQDKPNSLPETILPAGGFYNTQTRSMESYDFRASATYNTTLKDDHIINTYLGSEVNSQDRVSRWMDGWGMQYDSGLTPFWDYRAFKRLTEKNWDYYGLSKSFGRSVAFFANATYSYKGRYTITGTTRYEGTNRLGRTRKARWLPTWNISGAWNAHSEDFFEKQHLLSHLTLKGSYSLVGVAPSWVTNSRAIIYSRSAWRPSAGQSENRNYIGSFENEDLTYEKKHELNFGIDMGMLKNRLNIAADIYWRNNFDLIGAAYTIGGTRWGNVAAMKSHGFELSISTKNIQTKDFSWTTDFIFGSTFNKVTELDTKRNMFNFLTGNGFARQGYPVRSLFSIPFTGLDNEGFPTFMVNGKEVTRRNYRDINFQQVDDLDFLKYEGSSEPTYNGSFGNVFTFKNFKLNVFLTYSGGNKLRLDPSFYGSYSDLWATPKEYRNRWTTLGDEHKTDIPVIASVRDHYSYSNLGTGYAAYNYSTARVADGSFVRLKEVSLTYTLPTPLIKRLGFLKSASFKVQATNLALLYADKKLYGQDPEFFRSGGVATPLPKQVTATVHIGF